MTTKPRTSTPRTATILLGLLLFQGVSALIGGSVLILDPSGGIIGMSTAALQGSPFANYLIPGLILFCVLGVLPMITAYGLWRRPSLAVLTSVERTFEKHWSWVASLMIGFALIFWIIVQGFMIGFGHPLQVIYFTLGVIIVLVTLLPSVQHHFQTIRLARA